MKLAWVRITEGQVIQNFTGSEPQRVTLTVLSTSGYVTEYGVTYCKLPFKDWPV